MKRWGRFVSSRARSVLIVSILVALAMGIFGGGVFGALSNGGFDDPKTDSAREFRLEQRSFGNHGSDLFVIYQSDTMAVTDPAFRASVQQVVDRLRVPQVSSVTTWYQTHAPTLISKNGHATAISVTLAGSTQDQDNDDYLAVKDKLAAAHLTTYVGGQWAVFGDVNTTVSKDIERAETISAPVVLLLSLLIFGSLVAALMPLMVGGIAVIGAFAVVRLIALGTDVSIFAINVITLLGLGLAIDYALFVVSRFREELAKQEGAGRAEVNAAVAATMATAGRTVLVSGVTVAAALSSLLIFPQTFLRSMGYGGIAAVLVAMTGALTILPAVLTLLGARINAVAMPWQKRAATSGHDGGWARLAHAVMRRPAIYLIGVVVVLLAIGSPILGVKWGGVDYRVLPTSAPSRVAIQKQIDEMGGERSTADIVLSGADAAAATGYVSRLGRVPGVLSASVIDSRPAERKYLVQATWIGNTQAQRSQDLVRALRAVPAPNGAAALVGGVAAQTVDLLHSVGHRLPWMALVIVLVMLVLLFIAFGSFVLPFKAVVMNAVSITASFGVVTWIFADGHLTWLLGFSSNGYLDATQPILMLAILFGLSMDYEVFLLSRIREHWDATHDNTAAVAAGVQRTGRIITSAAVLLAVVIGAFSTSGIVFIKMIGVGMLVAILVDATVVRMLLVPATMRLLGDWNWWAPGPFRRWYERHGLHESDGTEPAQRELVRA